MIGRMRVLLKLLAFLFILALLVGAGAWFWAGRMVGPTLELKQPEKYVGAGSSLELRAESPDGQFSRLDVTVEQNGKAYPVYSLERGQTGANADPAKQVFVMRPIGKRAIPALQNGPARIVVHAARPVLYGMRDAETSITRDVQVRLEPPRVEVLSTFHYVNLGGSEFVVYRATPADVESGVRVGDKEYRGYPASGAGIQADPATRVAFFALLFDQSLNTPISVFARDVAGNEVVSPLDHMVFPKVYQKSRIEIDDKFIGRVVPAIAANSPDDKIDTTDLLKGFLQINRDLRKKNNQYLIDLAKKSNPELMFRDAFQQLGNSQVEAKFADTRTYIYKGKDVDQQVHQGFDLAVTANVPIVASQKGTVVHAADLGIYGNCVVIDHGMGIQSLYGHLSSIGVKVGDTVAKGQQIGRSGMTGLAGGDHLHFTMLVGGQQVTPVDWWSQQWMQDRVLRKLMQAGQPTVAHNVGTRERRLG
jgi:murein DD-endopeptidase MepM/ murein hydrolase activator NlpD